ncbi:N-formylglutamate deformylase [Dorcoceras hygrometricum]|uniref:N-formylglutamate deformylase n=1 Tax=Dorcoceras hygrometricum TaxID=472368 RepID=A0A2Z7BFS0_9LAMI|nr:N-formylglutamate deformylase [Dorcoceras hygrometricum]
MFLTFLLSVHMLAGNTTREVESDTVAEQELKTVKRNFGGPKEGIWPKSSLGHQTKFDELCSLGRSGGSSTEHISTGRTCVQRIECEQRLYIREAPLKKAAGEFGISRDDVSVTQGELLVLVLKFEVAAGRLISLWFVESVARAVDRYDDVGVTYSLLLVVDCVVMVAADQQARKY